MLGAMGVVYGDIGTSPLYTLKEAFTGHHSVDVTHDNVLGILSLVFWSLMIIVTLKYVTIIMRADNRGEGGIMALTALVLRATQDPSAADVPDGARPLRRGALLRRQHDHAGDLGAVGGRGSGGRARRPSSATWYRSPSRC